MNNIRNSGGVRKSPNKVKEEVKGKLAVGLKVETQDIPQVSAPGSGWRHSPQWGRRSTTDVLRLYSVSQQA